MGKKKQYTEDGVEIVEPKKWWRQERAIEMLEYLRRFVRIAVLDTETTGLGPGEFRKVIDEIVEIAIVDFFTREVLLHGYAKPKAKFDPIALKKTNFDLSLIRNAPSFEVHVPRLAEIAAEYQILAWNSPFDQRLIFQTMEVIGWNTPMKGLVTKEKFVNLQIDEYKTVKFPGAQDPITYPMGTSEYKTVYGIPPMLDLMPIYSDFRVLPARCGLGKAMERERLSYEGMAHTAIADCKATIDVLKVMYAEID